MEGNGKSTCQAVHGCNMFAELLGEQFAIRSHLNHTTVPILPSRILGLLIVGYIQVLKIWKKVIEEPGGGDRQRNVAHRKWGNRGRIQEEKLEVYEAAVALSCGLHLAPQEGLDPSRIRIWMA